MGVVGTGLELGVELDSHEPGVNVLRQLNDLDQILVGGKSREDKTRFGQRLAVSVVELPAVTMTLVDERLAVNAARDGTLQG